MAARHLRAFHAEVVAEHRPGEAEVVAQDALQPARARTPRVAHRPSDRSRAPASRWRALVLSHSYGRASSARMAFSERLSIGTSMMRVASHVAVPWEMLAAVRHAGEQQAVHQALREHRHDARVAMERAIADHAARSMVEVEHRREAQVDAAGAQLGAEHEAARGRGDRVAVSASFIHSSPSARIGGRCVKPSLRKRCTRPPSWSTQISMSGRIDLISAVSSVSWRRLSQLRANRISPPVSGCSSRRRSSGLSARPAMSRTTGACVRGARMASWRSAWFRPRQRRPHSRFHRTG